MLDFKMVDDDTNSLQENIIHFNSVAIILIVPV